MITVNHEVGIYTCVKCGRVFGVSMVMLDKPCPYCLLRNLEAREKTSQLAYDRLFQDFKKLRRQVASLKGALTKARHSHPKPK